MSDLQQDEALSKVRAEIDDIDQQIQSLINRRASCAQRVADIKQQFGADSPVFYRPEREAQVLRRAQQRNKGPLPDYEIARLFREVMSICLAHEHRLNVGYCSSNNAEADKASLKQFGHSVEPFALKSVTDLFAGLHNGTLHYAIVSLFDLKDPDSGLFDQLRTGVAKVVGEVCLSKTSQYIVLGNQWVGPSGHDKTAFVLNAREGSSLQFLKTLTFDRTVLVGSDSAYVEVQGQVSLDDFLLTLDGLDDDLSAVHLGCFPRAVF